MQIGIYGQVHLERRCQKDNVDVSVYTDYNLESNAGEIYLKTDKDVSFEIILKEDGKLKHSEEIIVNCRKEFRAISGLDVIPWWPNGLGDSKLYDLSINLIGAKSEKVNLFSKKVGFKNVTWKRCQNSPEKSDPWICCINGKDVFIQGVNWTPIRPNFADLKPADYIQRIKTYSNMGVNLLRVWGGGVLEHNCFYDICDEMGIMVWQEFPLCSSGIDNSPPSDEKSLDELKKIAQSYIKRIQSHASLVIWCGGNELQVSLNGTKGIGKPLSSSHSVLKMFKELVREIDPAKRYLPTSASGPRFLANEKDFGLGLHWDVHGPWKLGCSTKEQWEAYWQKDDSLFRSEIGVPAPSDSELIRKYAGNLNVLPVDVKNPLWTSSSWWIEDKEFCAEKGYPPVSIEEYVKWGQERQMEMLSIAVKQCKDRFPKCGGIVLWMGHDSWPCAANTSIIDFEGNLKPICNLLKKIFLGSTESTTGPDISKKSDCN